MTELAGRRLASVIGLDPAGAAEYEHLHASVWDDVLRQIAASGIRDDNMTKPEAIYRLLGYRQ